MSELSPTVIKKTQNYLGKYVKKPPLTEKLLKKPPFRFLHDIVKCVIKETGFLKGLFSEDELNSDKVKEKDDKIAFLSKLIDAVKTVTKTNLTVRPSKVVAGLEPEQTNILLQTIGKAIDKKVDTAEYVSSLKKGDVSKNDKNRKKDEKNSKRAPKTVEKPKENKVRRGSSTETPKSTDRRESSRDRIAEKNKKDAKSKEKTKQRDTKTKQKLKENQEKPSSSREPEISPHIRAEPKIETEIVTDVKPTSVVPQIIENASKVETSEQNENSSIDIPKNEEIAVEPIRQRQNSAGLIRPKSARPKSGDRNILKSNRVENAVKNEGPVELAPTGGGKTTANRPKSSLRPPSVRPSSARPGAPRLRPDSALRINEPTPMAGINVIVENFDNMNDDEDTVVIQNTSETITEEEDVIQIKSTEDERGNKGQLVEQILEQMQETEGDLINKKRAEVDWEQDSLRGKDATTKEVKQLRNLIQNLTKTANPLGKLMNYLHEDLDAMHNELQMWTATRRELFSEIEKQKKINAETTKPLLTQLEHLKQEIKKIEREILTARCNILKNEHRIKELLQAK